MDKLPVGVIPCFDGGNIVKAIPSGDSEFGTAIGFDSLPSVESRFSD
jgi:hypothetical protein